MSISIQTNVASLVAQENLNINSQFQSNTIQQLTSGYRINSAGDDAAGLAVANSYRNQTAQLTQGVMNANDGVSTLQIADSGMSNISQMLDRLQTLATQSASQAFTGDRNTLNSEFQSLLTEIDRQAQSIGLNTNGQLAKSVSVFIGGGKSTTGALNTANGTVTVDLSKSAVDTQALGLKGTQVIANSGADITAALSDATNTGSEASSGYTNFYFSGAGFSDNNQMKVAVNLSGVTNLNTLVSAINTAIQNAGAGTDPVSTAFRNAGIVASVHTDANGGQELAFTSASSAFQVQAGDRMANAFLGNLTGNSHTGAAISSTVTGAATSAGSGFNATNAVLSISGGGLTSPVNISLASLGASSTTAAALTYIEQQVASNTALQQAGISVNAPSVGSALVFTSAKGEQMNVQVTGDANGQLGFGSFVGNAGAVNYTTLTGGAYTAAGAMGTAKFEFSLNGGASASNAVSVDLNGGDATAATTTGTVANADAHGQALTVSIDGGATQTINIQAGSTTAIAAAADINAANKGITATVDSGGHLVITATAGPGHTFQLGGAAATTEGLSTAVTSGNGRSGQSIADALNSAFAANSTLQAAGLQATWGGGKLTIASSNGTSFRLNTGGSASTADVGFGTAGTSGYSGPTVAAAAQSVSDANGTTNTGAQTFTALQFGSDQQAITITAPDANGAMQSKTITLQNNGTSSAGSSIDSAVQYINQQLQASNNSTLQGIVAVKENVGGTEKINFLSPTTSFSVSFGATSSGDGFNAGVATTVAATQLGTGGTVSIDTQTNATQAISAVANAITVLGSAQAAVGKGENDLNYAVDLAQSQITNFSAAESRIRDADVAKEAANLTKAQVLQQASIAAMAQANSAPQAVLKLLQG